MTGANEFNPFQAPSPVQGTCVPSTRLRIKSICIAALLTATGAAQAAITFHTTQESFLAAVGQAGVDTFSELDPFVPFIGPPLLGPLSRNAGPFSYSVTTTTGELRAGFRSGAIFGGENQIWLESFRTQDTLIFSDFPSGVAGLGGNFFNTTFGGGVGAGVFGGVGITASDADGTASVLLRSTSLSTFLGVVSTTGSLSFVSAESLPFFLESPFTPVAVDNLMLATAIPEPQTYALMLAGLAGFASVGVMARRRQG